MCHEFSNGLVLTYLGIEDIEATAISKFSHPLKWWFRYVDDGHSCLKKDQVDELYKLLNSINPNTQCTMELENTNGQGLPFVDTTTTRSGTAIQGDVYRKLTHIDRYLDFRSCHLSCPKGSVVNTLLKKSHEHSVDE